MAGFDISSRHVEGANTDGILIVHGQKVAANKHCLHTSTPCLDERYSNMHAFRPLKTYAQVA